MIEVINVNKHYPTASGNLEALKAINLHVNQGEIYGVIGKSGAGKSTLIRCINLLERPNDGQIKIEDQDITQFSAAKLRKLRSQIGMIFQHFNILVSKTVWQNVALPMQIAGKDKAHIKKRVQSLLDLVGLGDKAKQYPAQLSGGQKQRVAIARALANDPKVLLCDEATSALDPQTTSSILRLLKDINQRFGLTILLITHEMDVIKQICDRVALLDQGEIIEQADTFEFFSQPKTAMAQQLVHSALAEHLPDELLQRIKPEPELNTYPIARILFHGAATKKPLIAHLIKELGLEINILQANIEIIKGDTFGIMLVGIKGDSNNIDSGVNYLRKHGMTVEVMGYADYD